MLFGLRHPTFFGVDNQDATVDRADARKHVAQKANMSGHVDKTRSRTRRQLRVRKTQVDGHATAFFFGPPIGVCTRQREHE